MRAAVKEQGPCVEKGDTKCILQQLAQRVGIEDMIELRKEVEPKLRPTIDQMKAENQEAINKLKTAKSGEESREIVCKVRLTKAQMIDAVLAKL